MSAHTSTDDSLVNSWLFLNVRFDIVQWKNCYVMANFNIEHALSDVKDLSTKQLIEFLLSENKKSQEIITQKNEVCALEQRITLQERNSSKDCLIV